MIYEPEKFRVITENGTRNLTLIENKLMMLFKKNTDKVIYHIEIAREVLGVNKDDKYTRSAIVAHIKRLRNKIYPATIHSIYKIGYIFIDEEVQKSE